MRLPCLLFLLLLPQASLSQQFFRKIKAPESCPVTKAGIQPFIPPSPYRAKPYEGSDWFGSDGLWLALPDSGVWRVDSASIRDPATGKNVSMWREPKVSWWRQGYDYTVEGTPQLKISGRRLDADSLPLVADTPNWVGLRAPHASMMQHIYFPTLGCWEITGAYEGDSITFVLWLER